jgi:hypothetical protein
MYIQYLDHIQIVLHAFYGHNTFVTLCVLLLALNYSNYAAKVSDTVFRTSIHCHPSIRYRLTSLSGSRMTARHYESWDVPTGINVASRILQMTTGIDSRSRPIGRLGTTIGAR